MCLALRFHFCAWVWSACLSLVAVASALADAPLITPAPRVAPRGQPYEGDPALFGYSYGTDYTFTPVLCYDVGLTLTTIGNLVHCCPTSTSTCRITTACSTGVAYVSNLGEKSEYHECSVYPFGAGSCNSDFIFDSYPADASTTQKPLYTTIGCGPPGYIGGGKISSFYRNIPASAVVNGTVSRQNTSTIFPAFTTQSVPGFATVTGSQSNPSGSSGSNSSPTFSVTLFSTRIDSTSRSRTSDFFGTRSGAGTSSPTAVDGAKGSGSASTEKDGGISRSDKIALGVGIGIGLPTVLLTALAWYYPRHWKGATVVEASNGHANGSAPVGQSVPLGTMTQVGGATLSGNGGGERSRYA